MRKIFSILCILAASICTLNAQSDEMIFNQARFHKGDAPHGWMTADFDDSSWQTISIPEKWHGEREYAQYRIKFNLPKEFVSQAAYKQYAIFDLAYIDDCDEAYLNGKLIGKCGVMPHEGMEYSAWDAHRVYQVSAADLKVGENVLTVLVWNRRTRGGVYDGPFKLRMANLDDLVTFSFSGDGNADKCRLTVTSDIRLKGNLLVEFGKTYTKSVSLVPEKPYVYDMAYDGSEPMHIKVTFTDPRTGQQVQTVYTPKYCLTPSAPQQPL